MVRGVRREALTRRAIPLRRHRQMRKMPANATESSHEKTSLCKKSPITLPIFRIPLPKRNGGMQPYSWVVRNIVVVTLRSSARTEPEPVASSQRSFAVLRTAAGSLIDSSLRECV